MPEKVDFEGLGDLDTIQDEFYQGLEEIEKSFHQLVEKAENNFDLKHSQLKMIYQKMYRNHTFISNLHEENMSEVVHKQKRVEDEKKDWVEEMAQIKSINKFDVEDIKLEVSGKPITVSLETLQSVDGSALSKMFSGKHELKKSKDGAIILDRDFEMFNIMINYLRSNRSEYPALGEGLQSQMFEQELDFWDVKTTNLEIEERRLRSKINPELIEFFDAEPSKACMEAKKKWRDLGVFRFEEIMRFSNDKNIDYEAKFGKSVKFSHFAGQLDKNGHVEGIGRYIINNGTIYEG
jgi:hypothetical protein